MSSGFEHISGLWSGVVSELGYVALLLAFVLAVLQWVLPSVFLIQSSSSQAVRTSFLSSSLLFAPAIAVAQAIALMLSFACLMVSFYLNDFSLLYVAKHSNTLMPWYYKLSASWGGHEGSLLLWVVILSLWCAAFSLVTTRVTNSTVQTSLYSRMFVVMGLVQTCMLALVVFSSSPFDKAFPLPLDGADLNPLLQDPGLIFHPPMLYMGYVGLVMPFAFAVAVLWQGKLHKDMAALIRPWLLVAWGFLTLGIALGSWWAYYELGWGGWWFWDPVENASLMPWLAATALIHSLSVTAKRGAFSAWTVMLSILAFGLSLLGTFLVRSGVLTSVHAFAADPERGLFVLVILAVLVGGSLTLFALRGWRLTSLGTFTLRSRESLLAINNMLLMTALLVVFLGTLYPIIDDAFGLGQVSVGAPYFNALFVPLTWLLLLAMGISPVLRWQQDKQPLRGAVLVIILSSVTLTIIVLLMLQQRWQGMESTWVTVALSLWVLSWMLYDIWRKSTLSTQFFQGLVGLPLPYWAMQLAHVGVIVCCLGVAFTSSLSVENDRAFSVGQTVTVADYEVHFDKVDIRNVDNYTAAVATFDVLKQGRYITTLYPEKRRYVVSRQVMTEAGIDGSLWRDIYIALGEPLDNRQTGQASRRNNASRLDSKSWAVRVYIKPMVRWIWLGALLMALSATMLVLASVKRKQHLTTK